MIVIIFNVAVACKSENSCITSVLKDTRMFFFKSGPICFYGFTDVSFLLFPSFIYCCTFIIYQAWTFRSKNFEKSGGYNKTWKSSEDGVNTNGPRVIVDQGNGVGSQGGYITRLAPATHTGSLWTPSPRVLVISLTLTAPSPPPPFLDV